MIKESKGDIFNVAETTELKRKCIIFPLCMITFNSGNKQKNRQLKQPSFELPVLFKIFSKCTIQVLCIERKAPVIRMQTPIRKILFFLRNKIIPAYRHYVIIVRSNIQYLFLYIVKAAHRPLFICFSTPNWGNCKYGGVGGNSLPNYQKIFCCAL